MSYRGYREVCRWTCDDPGGTSGVHGVHADNRKQDFNKLIERKSGGRIHRHWRRLDNEEGAIARQDASILM